MRILIAEDSDTVRLVLESTARKAGHDVTSVADGPGAWTAVQALKPDLVILDWQLPDLDGLEICRRIRADEALRDTFVLMVTARESGEDTSQALAAGVDDYFSKPIAPAHLRARLQIAEQRIAQTQATRHAEQVLAHARWLAGIGETTVALQHELNNPLFALMGHAELFAADPSATETQRAEIATILEQAHRIANVVRRLAMLKSPRTVSYLKNSRMLDLSEGADATAEAP